MSALAGQPDAGSQPLTIPDAFELFWSRYPRKEGKGKARLKWTMVTKTHPAAYIIAALELQIAAGVFEDKRIEARRRGLHPNWFIAHPATWLHQERWDDEIVPRERPQMRNGAAELLMREAEEGMIIDGASVSLDYLDGPGHD